MGDEGGKKENPNDDKSDVVNKEDTPEDEGEKKDNKDDNKGYDNNEKVDKDNEDEDLRLIKRRTS